MPQIHRQQFGLFHVITKTQGNIPWCIRNGVPEHLISTLVLARNIYGAKLHAFCILPNHLHILLTSGEKGLSRFVQAFKSNSVKELRKRPDGLLKSIRWQAGFYDERIRDERQQAAVVAYIQGNAMKHGLVDEITNWPWTSLHFPSAVDPLELW